MQNCLEVIADAVLQVVLFQVEADENESHLLNPDATPLVDGVCLLIDLAKKKAALWSETQKQENQEKMLELCREVKTSAEKIGEYLQILRSSAYDQDIKEELLFTSKNCMVYTVHLMELADQYDIYHIEKQVKYVKREQKKLIETSPQNFKNNIESYIIATSNLALEIEGRANYIVDPLMKENFYNLKTKIQQDPENLIKLTAYLLQEPSDCMARDQQEELIYSISADLDELIELAILSSKQLFEGILVDLDPIDRDKLINRFLPTNPSCNNIIDAMQKILETMTKNSQDGKQTPVLLQKLIRNAQDLNSALASLRDLVEKEISEEESIQRKEELQSLLDTLENILRDNVLFSIKQALSNPTDDNIDDLLNAIARMANVLDKLRRVLDGEDDFDLLNGSVSRLQKTLQDLKLAMESGDKQGMLNATKDAVHKMKAQQGTVEDVSPSLLKLVEGTKAAMNNPNDLNATKRLQEALDECRDSTHNLSPSSILPRSKLLNSIHQLDKLAEILSNNPPGTDQTAQVLSSNNDIIKAINAIISDYNQQYPEYSIKINNALQGLNKTNTELTKSHDLNNLPQVKDMRAKQREACLNLLNETLLAESDSSDIDSLIDSVSFLNHILDRLQDSLKMGDTFTATDSSKMTQNLLNKQSLLTEMIAKQRIQPKSEEKAKAIISCSEELKTINPNIPIITNTILKDASKLPQIKKITAKVRNINERLLNNMLSDTEIGDKIAELNLDTELDADNIEEILSRPTSQGIQDIETPLAIIVERVGQQKLLSNCVLQRLPIEDSFANKRNSLNKALDGVNGTLNRLRTTAADAMKPGADRVAKNRLKKALTDVITKSEELTAASQSSLIHRILANGAKFNNTCGIIANNYDKQAAFTAVKDGKAIKRFEKQIHLCHQMANQCNNPQLKLVIRKLVDFANTTTNQCKQQIPSATTAAQVQPVFDRLRQINEKLLIAAQRAENCMNQDNVTTLAGAANHMHKASEFLHVDESPQGKLNEIAKLIAIEMKKMSESANKKDKRGIITSAKQISQLTTNIVRITSSIPSHSSHKQFKNEMLSMATAARNYSVQLKILAAVKTASPSNDPTADTQLISCAKGLSHSVIETINGAEVLALKGDK